MHCEIGSNVAGNCSREICVFIVFQLANSQVVYFVESGYHRLKEFVKKSLGCFKISNALSAVRRAVDCGGFPYSSIK